MCTHPFSGQQLFYLPELHKMTSFNLKTYGEKFAAILSKYEFPCALYVFQCDYLTCYYTQHLDIPHTEVIHNWFIL